MFSNISKVVKKYSGIGADSPKPETSGTTASGSENSDDKRDKLTADIGGLMRKFKSGIGDNHSNELNPIEQFFEVGKETASVGNCLTWRVYNAHRKVDGKECSVFFFDKRIAAKLYKPKRKEPMLERIKDSIAVLASVDCPRMLEIIHPIEETKHTLAFASEPILGSLYNILSWHETNNEPGSPPTIMPYPNTLGHPSNEAQQKQAPVICPPFAKEYHFLDIEIRYGVVQIIEALKHLHYSSHLIHRNVCPQTIIITKRGIWKLFGLEYSEPITPQMVSPLTETILHKQIGSPNADLTDPSQEKNIKMIPVVPWSTKFVKLVQPNLDFIAPEAQLNGQCNDLSDMFSLGLVICALFNNGKSLIQANNNPLLYLKQMEYLHHQFSLLKERIPIALQEPIKGLLAMEPHPRPSSQLLSLINYFKAPPEQIIPTLQILDTMLVKNPHVKRQFYTGQLMDTLPNIPKKLRWQNVWPIIQLELRAIEMLEAALIPAVWFANDATPEEFELLVLPSIKSVLSGDFPKNIKSYSTILESMHIFLEKSSDSELSNELMTLLYTSLDVTSQYQLQKSSFIALQNLSENLEDKALHKIILPKMRLIVEKRSTDLKVLGLALGFYEKIFLRLDRPHILENIIPTLLAMDLNEPDIINRVVKLYKSMLMEEKFGLTTNIMATRMIPILAPQTINVALNVNQFSDLMEIIYDMLENIDQNQRRFLKLDNLSLSERYRLRYKINTDNLNPPEFVIPNLRVQQRKTTSAEDMAHHSSISGPPTSITGSVGSFRSTGLGQWFFGSNSSKTNNDNKFLRMVAALPGRRLSDNTVMPPKVRIATSCTSSPVKTPGTSGLPTRRHSSIGSQERRGSAVNLSPPTGNQYKRRTGGSGSSLSVPSGSQRVGGSVPDTSTSVPSLLTSSMHSIRSRCSSAVSGSQGSGLLQQLSSGTVRHLPAGLSNVRQPHLTTNWSAPRSATSAGYNALQHTYQLFSGRT